MGAQFDDTAPLEASPEADGGVVASDGHTGLGQPAAPTVLVVEDEDEIRLLLHEILAEAGYRVLEAADGAAGLRLLRGAERIDLLITDLGLPGGLNGREVAAAGRAARPDLPVLFVTGYGAGAAVGRMDGRTAVLTKPFNIAELESQVWEMVTAA